MTTALDAMLERAIAARGQRLDDPHEGALRLFDGFTEGEPALAVDLYARTAVLHDYDDDLAAGAARCAEALASLTSRLPWLRAAVRKVRAGTTEAERNGVRLWGEALDRKVREHGVWYAVDLTMNRDASLYLDTRELRAWALAHLAGKRVLNTFAYTCSLGVAARAAGAARVLNTDRNARFLALGRASYALNGFAARNADFLAADFFPCVSRLKRAGERFDCVFLDPPFFSSTKAGVVDLEHHTTRLINKVRPLVDDGGWLVAVNNALYVSGAAYMAELDALCADGYLRVEETIAVPADFVGDAGARAGASVADPAPFNHPTKIAVLRVRRKAG